MASVAQAEQDRRLEGWKEIGQALKRPVAERTAQDYAKLRGLPVRRSFRFVWIMLVDLRTWERQMGIAA